MQDLPMPHVCSDSKRLSAFVYAKCSDNSHQDSVGYYQLRHDAPWPLDIAPASRDASSYRTWAPWPNQLCCTETRNESCFAFPQRKACAWTEWQGNLGAVQSQHTAFWLWLRCSATSFLRNPLETLGKLGVSTRTAASPVLTTALQGKAQPN